MLKYTKYLIPAALVVLVLWLLLRSWSVEVPVGEATRGTSVDAVTGTVEILAYADLWVRTEREGRLAEILVETGERVEKDQIVAVQESRLLDLQLQQEQVRLTAARERAALPLPASFDVENLESEVEALRLQVEMGQISRARLVERERDLNRLRARLAEERIQRDEAVGVITARVEELLYHRERTNLRAPIDGKVIELVGVVGDRLNNNASVLRLLSEGRYVEMELSEEDFGGVEIGQRVTLRFASYPNREFQGTVDSLAPTADARAKTRKLFVKVDADTETLVPGLTGEGYLIKGQRDNAVLIPRRALIGRRVYVVNDSGRIEVRPVQVGFLSLNRAEILQGIEPGERIVLEGQDRLREGQSVTF